MSARRGRPPLGPEKRVQTRATLPPALLERVDAYAAEHHGGNRSAAIAELVRQGLELVRAEESVGVASVYAGACPRCGATFRSTRDQVTCDCGELVNLATATGPRQGS